MMCKNLITGTRTLVHMHTHTHSVIRAQLVYEKPVVKMTSPIVGYLHSHVSFMNCNAFHLLLPLLPLRQRHTEAVL